MELLAYTSTAAEAVDGSDVFAIVAVSARNNAESELTGVLLFKDGQFLQVVEGPSASIDMLMIRLERDNRHSNIRTIARSAIKTRKFPRWNMKRLYNLTSESDGDDIRLTLMDLDVSEDFSAEVSAFFDGSEKAAA
ncbi:MAG: BLUF domain-containing protein [Erythrobacter sp.]